MKIYSNLHHFTKDVIILVRSPVFFMLTLVGNGAICLSAALFFYLEKGINARVNNFIDLVWWAYATATTTGYGDITPVTIHGKLLGICLMLIGTALFAMYTGLFAEIIITNAKRHR